LENGIQPLLCSVLKFHDSFIFYLFFWVGLGFELRGLLAKQALYHLSHASSPFFALVILEMGVLQNYLPRLASNCDPADLILPSKLGFQA
jgi:hypothetical protein